LQIIYLAPFLLLSATLGVILLVVSRLRHHAVSAVVAVIAFAGCSIFGVAVAALVAEHFGLDHALGFDEPVEGAGNIVKFVSIYVLFGAVGAVLAVLVVKRMQRWVFRGWPSRSD
jgi:hypothetical protein